MESTLIEIFKMLEMIKVSKSRPKFPKSGLVLYLDAADQRSYNGSNIWNDLSGKNNHMQLYPGISKVGDLLFGNGEGGYAKSISTLDLTSTKDVTIVFVMKSSPDTLSVTYEHTENWNNVNNYNGNAYGGFGLAVNSSGSLYVPHQMHFQFKGNSAYSGINIDSPNSYNETLYTIIHSASETTVPQTTAYVNGIQKQHDSGNIYNGISTNFLGDDYFFMWGRNGNGTSTAGMGLMLIYDRKLSLSEIQYIKSIIEDRFNL